MVTLLQYATTETNYCKYLIQSYLLVRVLAKYLDSTKHFIYYLDPFILL